ncbi:hypothetical protein ULMS_04940 [Patiriisocius marinistellae]|uniref:Carboxypeptidase regulatory-like domain-containing protein n=1 Tax=Patiriisocius marinistellae TaxID=2494560 RepID=A0A5J4FY07_9FLAO|nr:hypothetical protein [Patiriisocius marinistellae]GEQ84986.1 hypothetical protein ULMS_04940 [Patiriisocius marinistellae]
MSQKEAYNRMIMSLTRSVMLLMSIAVAVFVFTNTSDAFSNTNNEIVSLASYPTDGAILGDIDSDDQKFIIKLKNENKTFEKTLTSSGQFFFKGIEPGEYDVIIQSTSDKNNQIKYEDVTILKGEVTALGINEL